MFQKIEILPEHNESILDVIRLYSIMSATVDVVESSSERTDRNELYETEEGIIASSYCKVSADFHRLIATR